MSDETPLGAVLHGLAQAAPGRAAVTCGGLTRSRAELEARTNRLARAYQALGVTHDSFVTIGLPNGLEFYEAVLAAWKAGATPQPISSRLPVVERLVRYKVPRTYEFVAEPLRGDDGKVRRSALRAARLPPRGS